MNAADTSANEPDQRSGLSTGGKCGLWACGGCAFVLAVAIVVSGVIAARWLTRNPETLSKLYGGQPIPQILIQPGGPVRMISDEWIPVPAPVWSPEGGRVAVSAVPRLSVFGFLRRPPPMVIDPRRQQEAGMRWVVEAMAPRVVIFNVVEGSDRIAYQGSAERMQWPTEVAWFPDGRHLAVVVEHIPMGDEQQKVPPELWIVDIEQNEPRKLADNVWWPNVSPNGCWIACRQTIGEDYERLVTVLDAQDGSELYAHDTDSGQALWDQGGNVLYFFSYAEDHEARGWRKVQLPAGKVMTVTMKEVQVSRPSRITSAQEISVHDYGGCEDEEEPTYRLRVRDFAQAYYYYLTPHLGTYFRSCGVCLGDRYVLVRTREALWAYRLADGKFYQVTDPTSLDLGWGTELDPSGTKVCLVGDLPEEDIFRIFTTGLSTPVMMLQLDEERILSQPGYDEPVLPSSENQEED